MILRNGNIVNDGRIFKGDIVVEGDFIVDILPAGSELSSDKEIFDLDGLYVFPGVIDTHVHFREPGSTQKGCIASESAAAALGGVTSYIDMPNNNPAAVTLDALENKFEIAERDSTVNYSFFLGGTNNNLDEVKRADFRHIPGVKVFLGSSTGNLLMDGKAAIHRLFEESPALVMAHCEDNGIIKAATEAAVAKYGIEIPFSEHPIIRSREACIAATKYAIDLALECNTRFHVAHLSTAEEVEMLKDVCKKSDRITGETCVQYLWFNRADYDDFGPLIKCNPAIKEVSDMEALREAVCEGLLNVSTDHAPHLLSEKQNPYSESPSGIPLVQYSLKMMLELSKKGEFPLERVVSAMCHEPASRFRIEKRGWIKKGYFADFVIVDMNAASDSKPASRCGWSPVSKFSSSILHTISNGKFVVKDGALTGIKSAKALNFSQSK